MHNKHFNCAKISMSMMTALLMLGCSGSAYEKTYPITGVVTHKGEPVEGATVLMVPKDPAGKSAAGETQADGTFVVTTYMDSSHQPEGAVAGDYSIIITKMEKVHIPEGMTPEEEMEFNRTLPKPKSLIPMTYANPETSGFQHTVSDKGQNHLVLELK